jgi:ankyrin repeat protein
LHLISSFKSLVEAKSIIGLLKSAIWDSIHLLVKEAVGVHGEKKARAFIMQQEDVNGSTPLHLACGIGNLEVIVGLFNSVKLVFAHNSLQVVNEMLN